MKVQELFEADKYQVGDAVKISVGGKWIEGSITKPLHKITGNYGVKFKVGTKTMNYLASLKQLKS